MMGEQMQGFAGFPAGKLATTPVPNLFFSELLPLVDNLAELKVILHLFWLIGKKRGKLRYARLDELLRDRRLLEGLATSKLTGQEVLQDALERAVARGALLHARVERGGNTEDWYMINTANGRAVLECLAAGELDLLANLGEDVQLTAERPTIFVLYEQNIGMLTPMIADELRDAERYYPAEWIADAFREAVKANKRSWRYVLRILERWRLEGRGAGPVAPPLAQDAETLRQRYGKRSALAGDQDDWLVHP
ncbi:MAG: DnaD domain-containing protein [Anaerolineae bacterium]